LAIDENTKNKRFGHYTRISMDIDLSQKMYNYVLVEREGYDFNVEAFFENIPNFATVAS